MGDVCISLTDKPQSSTANSGQKVTNPSVPIVNDSNQNICTDRTVKSRQGAANVARPPSNIGSLSDKLANTTQSDNPTCTSKRKRRWSAPDNLSQNEDIIQSS